MHCSGQNLSDCKVAGETCVDGICRCGALSSCEGRKTGAFCDPRLGECRCSENLVSCSNPFRGNICNSSSSSCTCSATALACNGNEYCTLGSCNGNLPNHNPYNHYVIMILNCYTRRNRQMKLYIMFYLEPSTVIIHVYFVERFEASGKDLINMFHIILLT